MAPCREDVSCFASFQEEVRDQGQIHHSTSGELVGIQSLAQGHFTRECVYPLKVTNCGWRMTCCPLYHPAAYTSWTLWHKKQIYPLCFFSPLLCSYATLSFCQEMRWLTLLQTVPQHKGNCYTHASCGERTGDKVHPLCDSVVLQRTHKHTGGHTSIYCFF